MSTRFKLRHDTAANWTENNPRLALGEPGIETDTRKTKYGDGVTDWTQLAYASAGVEIGNDGQLHIGADTTGNGGPNSIAIGTAAGVGQAWVAIAIGHEAGNDNQGGQTVAIGRSAGQTNQSDNGIAIGRLAGQTNQGQETVAIGRYAGKTGQNQHGVAIGATAAETNQNIAAIAIGEAAGNDTQGFRGIAIGRWAASSHQGDQAVAIGALAGQENQGQYATAIGRHAAQWFQSAGAIAIGNSAATGINPGSPVTADFVSGNGAPSMTVSNASAIRPGMMCYGTGFVEGAIVLLVSMNAITLDTNASEQPAGTYSFLGKQGANSIAIGEFAAVQTQHPNSIVINSTGAELPSAGENTVVIKTVRTISDSTGFLPCYYNPVTGELVCLAP